MIRRHTAPPPRPREKDLDEQFAAFLRWQTARLQDPTDPSRAWPRERDEAHLAETWPALQQLRVWSHWYNQQPARQGPTWQNRGTTVPRSLFWIALWALLMTLAVVNYGRAVDDANTVVQAIAALTIGVSAGFLATRLIGLYFQVRECTPDAPTNGDTKAYRWAEAARRLEEGR